MKYLEKITHTVILSASIGFCSSVAFADSINGDVVDHYKTVINKTPYNVEVCENISVSGDKTGDTLMGAIIGGAIGDAVSGGKGDTTAAGAVIGGIIGADRAGTRQEQVITGYRTERQCSEVMVREEQREIRNYTITYRWNGISAQSYTYNRYSVGDRIPVTVSINAN